jgi:hypothetical protein
MKYIANGSLFSSLKQRAIIAIAACGLLFIALPHQAFGQWKQGSGNPSGQLYNFFGVSFGGSNYLLISAQSTGLPIVTIDSLFASTDNGQSWRPFAANGGSEMTAVTISGIPSLIGSASFPQGNGLTAILSYSTATSLVNPLQTWLPDTLGFPTTQPSNDPLASSLVTIGSTVYAADGQYGVYQQTAPGAKWTPDTVGMSVGGTPYPVGDLFVLGNYIFANAGLYGGIFASSSQGASWFPAHSGIPNTPQGKYLPVVAKLTASGSSLFAMVALYDTSNFSNNLHDFYRSNDNGQTWTLMNSTHLDLGNGVARFTASSNLLFAASDSTVNFSNDNGATWHQADQGLPNFGATFSNITSITVSGTNLVIAVLGSNQIWYRPLSEFVASSVAPAGATDAGLSLALSGNPASGSEVKAIYTLSTAGTAQVKLTDELGRDVRVLQDGRASAGQNVVAIDPLTVEPGTYFVRVEANGMTAMQKLVVTR